MHNIGDRKKIVRMLATFLGVLATVALCVWIFVMLYTKYSQSWQNDQEQTAITDFSNKSELYNDSLHRWMRLFPAKCGVPDPTPGFVTFQSITVVSHGVYSLDINGQSSTNLDVNELARRLGASPRDVGSLVELLSAVSSNEVIQSGAEFKIISPRNDTHGILHIDSTCPDAATYSSLSRSTNDRGRYVRLRSLGNGWYYYAEQR